MQKEKKEKHFVKKPIYPGGRQALKQFVRENLIYPEAAAQAGITGTVNLRYTIDHSGKVIDAKVISGLGHGCDEEAIRIVKLFKFEIPQQRKKRLRFYKTINIHFRNPPRKKPKPEKIKVQYQITTSAKKEEKPKEKNNGGYGYTISF